MDRWREFLRHVFAANGSAERERVSRQKLVFYHMHVVVYSVALMVASGMARAL